MTRAWLAVLVFVPGCLLFFDDGGKRPPDDCTFEGDTRGNAEGVSQPLRDPERLTCQEFGGGCDPSCGPCPAAAPSIAFPSWGVCGSSCEQLTEAACAAAAECRVVRDARCAVSGTCETDFVGCFPVDTAPDTSVDCFRATTGWECSRS